MAAKLIFTTTEQPDHGYPVTVKLEQGHKGTPVFNIAVEEHGNMHLTLDEVEIIYAALTRSLPMARRIAEGPAAKNPDAARSRIEFPLEGGGSIMVEAKD